MFGLTLTPLWLQCERVAQPRPHLPKQHPEIVRAVVAEGSQLPQPASSGAAARLCLDTGQYLLG